MDSMGEIMQSTPRPHARPVRLTRRGFLGLAGFAGASALGVSGCGWLDKDTDRPELPLSEARVPVWVRDTASVDAIVAGPPGTLLVLESHPSQRLVQLDAATGTERWARPVGRPYDVWWDGADGVLVHEDVTTSQREWLCLDAATGRERWRVPGAGYRFDMMLVADGLLLLFERPSATDPATTLLALDAAAGRERWRIELPRSPSLAIAGDGFLVTYGLDTDLTVVDLATGAVRWTTQGSGLWDPVLRDGVVFSVAYGVGVTAREAATGVPRWEFPAEDPKSLLTAGDLVYADVGDQVVALDRATGRRLWRIKAGIPGHDWPGQSLSHIDGGTLFTSVGRHDIQGDEAEGESYGGLAAYDAATGQRRWWYDAGGMGTATVTPTTGVICTHDGRRSLHAVDVATGRRLWWYDTGSELPQPLVVAADLVVGCAVGHNRVFALRP